MPWLCLISLHILEESNLKKKKKQLDSLKLIQINAYLFESMTFYLSKFAVLFT